MKISSTKFQKFRQELAEEVAWLCMDYGLSPTHPKVTVSFERGSMHVAVSVDGVVSHSQSIRVGSVDQVWKERLASSFQTAIEASYRAINARLDSAA
jgi:hypothetical protein